jgi:hypothetical protein
MASSRNIHVAMVKILAHGRETSVKKLETVFNRPGSLSVAKIQLDSLANARAARSYARAPLFWVNENFNAN